MLRTTKIFIISLTLGLCGLAAAADDDLNTTFDGLERINKGAFKLSWADPEIDFAVYDKVIPGGAFFEFRAVKKTSSTTARRSNQREFWISDKDKQRLEETVTEIFAEELGKAEHFEIVSEPGPDTMIIRGGLYDIMSQVPPELIGRGEIYLSSVGEATLVIEAVDSLSGEVIYRGVERRSAQQAGGYMVEANTVTTWAQVRRLARRWATRLRTALDGIHE